MSTHVINSNESMRWSSLATTVDGTGATRLEVRRRTLQVILGLVWLVDAALQFQPFMFTKGFVNGALEPTASGNPWLFAQPMMWADHLMIHGIAWWNALFAVLQLLIAVGLFWRRSIRWALGISLVWSLAVWWFAEGFGGIFSSGSPLSGQPGAVVLYALLAVLVWPSDRRETPSVVAASPWGARGARVAWVVLWMNFAVYFLVPSNRTSQAMHDLVRATASGEPHWIQSIDRAMAGGLNGRGVIVSIALALLCVVVAVVVAVPSLVRPALLVAFAFAAFVWLAQDFGGVFTSRGTDVNSGPLIALLAWSYWPLECSRRAGC